MNSDVFIYQDSLSAISEDLPLARKFDKIRAIINLHYPFITRIATALYDPATDLIKTFIQSGNDSPLVWYQTKLSESTSLSTVRDQRLPRVINDLSIFSQNTQHHTRAILEQGYQASYTLPVYHKGEFFGFVFFNSERKDVFRGEVLLYLDSVANLLSHAIVQQMLEVRTLLAAVRTVQDITQKRDNETGFHLRRMANYAHMIARRIAPKYDLSDEYIEYIHLFAPLHDVGKISIPDKILLKNGPLNECEFEIMKTHTTEGRKIIDNMLENFQLKSFEFAGMLAEIVEDHHETVDGKGYRKLSDKLVPLAARIIAVADVFDALTSKRSYKEAWSNSQAIEEIRKVAGTQLDTDCVNALCEQMEGVEEVQRRFRDEDECGCSGVDDE